MSSSKKICIFTSDLISGGIKQSACDRYSAYNISFSGYVENMLDILKGRVAMFAPMFDAGGVKTKLLDSFSMGLPVITNHNGAAGLAVGDCESFLYLCENDEQVCFAIEQLTNEVVREEKVAQEYKFFKSNYSFEVVEKKYRQVFRLNEAQFDK